MTGQWVIVEGQLDRIVLETLRIRDERLKGIEINAPEDGGREGAMKLAATWVKSGPVVLLLDRNGHQEERLEREVRTTIGRFWEDDGVTSQHSRWIVSGERVIHLCLAGLPEEPALKDYGCSRFAIDDYLLAICCDDAGLASFVDKETQLLYKPQSAQELCDCGKRILDALPPNSRSVPKAKRVLDVVKLVIGFSGAPATLAEKLISRCPDELLEKLFGSLIAEILEQRP